MELRDALLKRRSVRKFEDKPVERELIEELLHAAMSGPSACNKTPWEFYVVKNGPTLNSVKKSSLFSRFNSSLVIVVCGNTERAVPAPVTEYWVQDPSFLVGYQMTLDSIRKAGEMDIDRMLIPHYGVVSGEEARNYLANGQKTAQQSADLILGQLSQGKTTEEILEYMTGILYTDRVKPGYPYAAFRMNTEIMINLVRKELR